MLPAARSYCGHTMQGSGSIADFAHTICIDAGITQGKFLTCLDLHDFSFLQSSQTSVTRGVLR